MKRQTAFVACSFFMLFLCASMLASVKNAENGQDRGASSAATRQTTGQTEDDETMRFEGEKRYSANCGRCHQAPRKLSPRVMATAVRHMRVRATLSDEDMRYLIWYLTR